MRVVMATAFAGVLAAVFAGPRVTGTVVAQGDGGMSSASGLEVPR